MKTIFTTFVTNDEWEKYCAIPLQRSFKYFHPEIDFHIFNKEEYNKFVALDPWLRLNNFKATMGYNLCLQGYERVVILDADQIVVAPLIEVLAENWILASVRNNNDLDKAGCASPFMALFDGKCLSAETYLNAGLIGIVGKDTWAHFGREVREHGHKTPEGEQNVWNHFFYRCGYQGTLLDSKDKPYYYGTSSTWGNGSHWDSWKNAYLKDGQIRTVVGNTDKQIKILHRAGGCGMPAKQKFLDSLDNLFIPEVANFVKGIIYV